MSIALILSRFAMTTSCSILPWSLWFHSVFGFSLSILLPSPHIRSDWAYPLQRRISMIVSWVDLWDVHWLHLCGSYSLLLRGFVLYPIPFRVFLILLTWVVRTPWWYRVWILEISTCQIQMRYPCVHRYHHDDQPSLVVISLQFFLPILWHWAYSYWVRPDF